jgi:hypothetical protein
MNCKNCIYEKCLKHTDKEFDLCPVEAGKRKYEEELAKKSLEQK